MRPIYDARVIAGTFATLRGASGILKMVDPLPATETTELPMLLTAVTVAKMLEPHDIEKGD